MAINLADEIGKALYDYTGDVVEATNSVLEEVANEVVTKLKSAGSFEDQTGKYRKGWKAKPTSEKLGIRGQVIYNGKHYRLTHLLEFGHAKVNGGRVKAFPHIAPVEEELADKIDRGMKARLE